MPEITLKQNSAKKRQTTKLRTVLLIGLLAVFTVSGWIFLKNDTVMQSAVDQDEGSILPNIDQASPGAQIRPTVLKQFSGEEFVSFYNKFAYPNVREFESAPAITGTSAADERIRSIALERGYVGRSVAVPPLKDVSKDFQLQERAANDWVELVDAAKKDGQQLTLTGAFRTIEDQRDLFMESLTTTGATVDSIIAGRSDAAIISVLRRVSIPGYTRHHSGYAVDIGCQNDPAVVFGNSSCFTWLSKNNYEHAKTHGWIPAYPDGAPKQGPDPEPWEYCWVGKDALLEPVNI
jgi:LAS superfamily LD-carboxypeptidase LdcB